MKNVVFDVEANSLNNPDKIWVVVAKDLKEENTHVFRDVQTEEGKREFLAFWRTVDTYVGHNWLEYDYPVLRRLLGADFELRDVAVQSVDTLVLSRLADYTRSQTSDLDGTGPAVVAAKSRHSVAAYGLQFGFPKIEFSDFSQYSPEMEEYCVRDVLITEKIYNLHKAYAEKYTEALRLEQEFQFYVVNALQTNGFAFNKPKAEKLLDKVAKELGELDGHIQRAFPERLKIVREVHPRITQYGTLNKGDFRFVKGGDLSEFNGGPFCRCEWKSFNASSHSQVIEVLSKAGWRPTEKTKAYIDYDRSKQKNLDKGIHLGIYGWKISENNLSTLPSGAPEPARLLAKRILLESRRRTLTEWLSLVQDDGRIHGRFFGIGAWTHRMSHQNPNTANIPNPVYISTGKTRLYGKELRELWRAPRNRLLVGVDAEAIQLRVFAHLINEPELTNAILNGKKSDGTDPHSLNRKVFGPFCKTRNAAKHSLYAIFFGGRKNKISQIMACSPDEAQVGINNLLEHYPGLKRLEDEVFPVDAKRGYFIGLDGRKVVIPDKTLSGRKHLCMSGYLQCGEAVIMKMATLKFIERLADDDSCLVNLVHDEWQTEVPNNMGVALRIAALQSQALVDTGVELKLKCPLAGSFYNDAIKDYTIGTNWSVTH